MILGITNIFITLQNLITKINFHRTEANEDTNDFANKTAAHR